MKFPKLRGGSSPVGEGQVRQIQNTMGDRASAKKLGLNSRSYKRGEFYEVYVEEEEGMYLVEGNLTNGSLLFKIFGDEDARGKFRERPASGSIVVGSESGEEIGLIYTGAGRLTIPGLSFSGGVWVGYFIEADHKLTFAAEPISFDVAADGYGLRAGFRYVVASFGRFVEGTTKTDHFGAAFLSPDSPFSAPVYVFRKNGVWSSAGMLTYLDSSMSLPAVFQVGPADLVAITACYIFNNDDDGPNVPPFFSISNDAGATWFTLGSTGFFDTQMAMYADAAADLVAGMTKAEALLKWRHGLGTMMDYAALAPLSPTLWAGVMPRMTSFKWDTSEYPAEPGSELTAFIVTPSGATLGGGLGIYHRPGQSDNHVVLQAFHYEHAVYLQIWTPGGHVLWRTEDGAAWALWASLPYASENTGAISFDDRGNMIAPIYDPVSGEYQIVRSKDAGLTWAKQATITNTADAPPGGFLTLPRFSTVSYTIDAEGRDAPTRPQAPWIGSSDYEYIAP